MKLLFIRKVLTIGLIGVFSQLAVADDASAAKEIAGILVAMNHFPSDADKAKLMSIAHDQSLDAAVRNMATTVANISHAANADGKAGMASIVASGAADSVKALAGAIAGFNHMASADDKAKLTQLYAL
jgi:hypothetical protein